MVALWLAWAFIGLSWAVCGLAVVRYDPATLCPGLLWLFLGIVAGRVPAVVVVVFRLAVIHQDGPGRLFQACKLRPETLNGSTPSASTLDPYRPTERTTRTTQGERLQPNECK